MEGEMKKDTVTKTLKSINNVYKNVKKGFFSRRKVRRRFILCSNIFKNLLIFPRYSTFVAII
jgi:hypothetical protein